MKTNKSYTKRIRVTKRGKLIARHPGQNHFNAKESSTDRSRKGRTTGLTFSNATKARFLSGS